MAQRCPCLGDSGGDTIEVEIGVLWAEYEFWKRRRGFEDQVTNARCCTCKKQQHSAKLFGIEIHLSKSHTILHWTCDQCQGKCKHLEEQICTDVGSNRSEEEDQNGSNQAAEAKREGSSQLRDRLDQPCCICKKMMVGNLGIKSASTGPDGPCWICADRATGETHCISCHQTIVTRYKSLPEHSQSPSEFLESIREREPKEAGRSRTPTQDEQSNKKKKTNQRGEHQT